MLIEQIALADLTKDFLNKSGLKAKFVASKIGMDNQSFSKFCNHKLALPNNHLIELKNFMDDYTQRNNL